MDVIDPATEEKIDSLPVATAEDVDRALARRRGALAPRPLPERGWRRLYAEHVLQAHLGADLDFLAPEPPEAAPPPPGGRDRPLAPDARRGEDSIG